MAIIGKIRSYSGLLVIVIGVALAAFVLGDLFKNSGTRKMPPLAEINGEEITNAEFRQKVEEVKERIKQQNRTNELTSEQSYQAMQAAWESMVMDQLMMEEYKELGLAVKHNRKRKPSISSEELMYLLTSENPHPFIRREPAFQDQQTGQFNPALVQQFISMLDQQEQETLELWNNLEKQIKKDQLRSKYYTLISKGYYLPDKMAEMFYREQGDKAKAAVVGMLYRAIPDTSITLTDEDYQKYYDEHKKQYETKEPSANITYIKYDVKPSRKDYLKIQKQAQEYYQELENAPSEDIPTLVSTIQMNNYDSTWKKEGVLPARIDTVLFNAEPGEMVSMYQEDGAFHMARLMEIEYRPDSMRASHILVRYGQDQQSGEMIRSREAAKEKADSLYEVVQNNPEQFGNLASTVSDDPKAAQSEGDVEWFADGTMLPEFNEGVINHEVGEIFQTETRAGFHIVRVTGKKEPVKKIRVAQLEIPIEPTTDTYDSVWAEASQFIATYRSAEEFEQAVKEQNLEPREQTIRPMQGEIPGVGSAREIARWAFNEKTKENTVAENVFEGEDTYVAVLLKEKTESGIPSLNDVKDRIKTLVIREVKAKVLKQQMQKQLSGNSGLAVIARNMNASVDTIPNLSMASVNIPKFGPEPKVVGTILNSPKGEIKGPIQGTMGVYLFKVLEFTKAPETNNYARIRQQKQSSFKQQVTGRNGMGMVYSALKDISDIEDNRIRYY
ncbi:MAG: SurA N-terminal domain-containing protein [Bacteroidales bacterium]|nr:SurA N-terminal domain-containing protein [Bacteroidales bacterium]